MSLNFRDSRRLLLVRNAVPWLVKLLLIILVTEFLTERCRHVKKSEVEIGNGEAGRAVATASWVHQIGLDFCGKHTSLVYPMAK